MQESLVPPRSRRSGSRTRSPETRSPRARSPLAAEATLSTFVIRPFARYLTQIGRDGAAWLGAQGLTPEALTERDLRVPHQQGVALLTEAVALSGDAAIGVHAAHCVEAGDFDVLEYAAANCASVGEALVLACRFMALMHDGLLLELDVAPPLAALRVRGVGGLEHPPAGIEFLFASLLSYGSRSIGHRTRPLRVDFRHPRPARPAGAVDTAVYEEVFREVRFGCEADAMWCTTAALNRPHCRPDRSLLQILTNHADALLRQLARPPAFAERARAVIGETLLAGHSGADQVARRVARRAGRRRPPRAGDAAPRRQPVLDRRDLVPARLRPSQRLPQGVQALDAGDAGAVSRRSAEPPLSGDEPSRPWTWGVRLH
ncbi:MAG: AraC family transcriptional regulator [Deltaproteobacteria bacterium]|nr:MAG: AraC family transcriptional regulator [Deltaproteobacteria bacterium]